MSRIIFLILFTTLAAEVIRAADTMTEVLDERVRTLQARSSQTPAGLPVIDLDGNDILQIDFDILSDDREFLRYSLQHCNASWQPSGLVDSEFLDGFNEGLIEDYAFSSATMRPYVHYRLTLPNTEVSPRLSGNYLLTVYPETDPDRPLFRCRFAVSENALAIAGHVTSRTDVDYNKSHQQLELCIDTEGAPVEDIFGDMTVLVSQNGRYDNERVVGRPMRVSGSRAYFEHVPSLIFEAGNEYRRFETVSDQYPGMGVANVEYSPQNYAYVHTLYTDEARAGKSYLYDSDQNGSFTVRRSGSNDSDTDADYTIVSFSLDAPGLPEGSAVFIDGDFVNRRFDDNSRMYYNPATQLYERTMLLKQGAYNYQYLVVPPGAKRGYTAQIEGDHYETDNIYTVKVYVRPRGERYDRLIGTATVRSTD